ncbi:MAG: polysaccharide biosynthesis protein [Clostridiales bacterium]|nr:polysaccharide biosynthesis protein [Clostridiales bacterium]
MSKRYFVKGAAILAVAGLVAKIIGAIFRIPLMNIIGTEGMGIYQLAYPIYAFLLVISTSGIPTAISKVVSERVAIGDQRGAYRVFRTSFKLLFIIGLLTSLILSIGSPIFARLQGNDSGVYALMAISLSLFFVSIMSAYRGYFQGLQYMTPTALTQIIEQFGKLVMGLTLATLWSKKGPEYGAAGALLGVTLSEIAALALIMGIYRRRRKKIFKKIRLAPKFKRDEDEMSVVYGLLSIAIPVTIGASIMPIVNFMDSVIVINRLRTIGYAKSQATSLYGMLTGGANPIISLPSIFTIALAMSLVPAISESHAKSDWAEINKRCTIGMKLTLFIGLPAAIGVMILANPIIKLLYSNMEGAEVIATGHLLSLLSIGIIFLTLIQSLTAMLQGVGKVSIPVRNLGIGAALKIILTTVLVGMPSINIKGAAIGTLVCYGIAAVLDFIAVLKYTRMDFSIIEFIIKPIIATVIMGVGVFFSYRLGFEILGSNASATLLSIIVGIILYIIMVFATGMIKRQDLDMMPGGDKLIILLDKMGLLRA